MFYEYAVDPAVLSNWKDARYFLDAFGPWKGKFIAAYPSDWHRLVVEGLNCGDVEKLRIVEKLHQSDTRIFVPRKNATYDVKLKWLPNAKAVHATIPFHLVITMDESSPENNIADSVTLDERHELWLVHTGKYIARDPTRLAQEVRFLLQVSSKVVIIDPYFRADQDQHTQPIKKICEILPPHIRSLDIHCADHQLSYNECIRVAKRALPNIIPGGKSVRVICWTERTGGARLHNRFLLTDIAGIKFGDSIEQGDAGQQDHLNIMDEPSRAQCWSEYVDPGNAFAAAGAPVEINGRR